MSSFTVNEPFSNILLASLRMPVYLKTITTLRIPQILSYLSKTACGFPYMFLKLKPNISTGYGRNRFFVNYYQSSDGKV